MSTKVVISNPCRLSYPALFKPRTDENGANPQYQATVLIPKSDTQTLQMIQTAIQREIAAASAPDGKWRGACPPNIRVPLFDGDGAMISGKPWGDECKGHFVLRTTSKSTPPDVVDEFGNKALDASKFYAGCYCYFSVNIAPYDNNGKGIGAYLNCVMFAKDGDPLEAHASAKDDFASLIAARASQVPAAMPGMPVGMPPMNAAPAPATQAPAGFGGFYGIPGMPQQ